MLCSACASIARIGAHHPELRCMTRFDCVRLTFFACISVLAVPFTIHSEPPSPAIQRPKTRTLATFLFLFFVFVSSILHCEQFGNFYSGTGCVVGSIVAVTFGIAVIHNSFCFFHCLVLFRRLLEKNLFRLK